MKLLLEQQDGALEETAQCLLGGGVAVVATETVYGILTLYDNEVGRERIYQLKKRPATKRLQMLAPSLEAAEGYGVLATPQLKRLAARFWPGALTVVAPNRDQTDSIGLRVPDHPFVLALLRRCGKALAATSANRSGEPPAVNLADALAHLDGEPDVAIDGGVITVTGGQASTVVSLLAETPVVIREGAIRLAELQLALEG